ncbi:autotransporter domain-containing protein [Montanilutibacter psychrotolerans]|uniref:Autotransporter domain-containing protein n=1 Tax=Montanilutibacter psychrotolerans TaxID=1327343 RepID=A0A3M8T5D5_9GAMM|nr:autotransporter domain-containing protein [Lysobacter psychrotolerans]RNF85952.1 autotransporter domain-containing protein [Lysobacter psychrotolerans]
MKAVRTALAAALALAAAPAFAQTFSQTVFFGDSLTDSGFYRPFLIEQAGPSAALGGRFTTNPGLVWSEYLADFYGTGANSAWGLTSQGIVNADGTNYAAGGARITLPPGFPPTPPTQFAPSMSQQISAYLARTGGRADRNALYTVWGGANDLFFHINPTPFQTTQAQFLGAATEQVGLVARLNNAGARYILVPTMPDVGRTPFGLSQGPAGSAGITALVEAYNATLFGGIRQQNLRVIPLDTFHLIREIAATPSQFGFVNVTNPACGTTPSLVCTSTGSGYAFADGVHPSSEAHKVIADYAVSIMEAPRQLAVLPNSAAMVGRSRADRVSMHINGKPAGDGTRWWSDLRGDFQRYGHGDNYDGVGPSLTGGVDWTRGNLVFGAFGGYGRQSLDWGRRSGGFDQSDLSIGGFVGWYGEGGAWANGQASYSRLDYDIDRKVQLGQGSRTHNGDTDGDNITLAMSAGWEFGEGALRHGPVVSVVSQNIQIDGFAESDPSLSTSLAYSEQEYDSLLASVGWEASWAGNDHVKPYARATVDREFEDAPEESFARLQSMPGLAPYAVPGQKFDQRYGTLVLGVQTKLFGLDANLGTSVTVGQEGGNNTTVFASFGAGF